MTGTLYFMRDAQTRKNMLLDGESALGEMATVVSGKTMDKDLMMIKENT